MATANRRKAPAPVLKLRPKAVKPVDPQISSFSDTPVFTAPPILPVTSQARKQTPMYMGLIRYFPDALAAVAQVSFIGNEKHNPGEPLHWSRGKSDDHLDCVIRHAVEAGTIDPDDQCLHAAKLAWRALANLQIEIEERKANGHHG